MVVLMGRIVHAQLVSGPANINAATSAHGTSFIEFQKLCGINLSADCFGYG